ncbi:MAG: class I SAM-dependent methyltransferase [Vicinamibacteria bacterium]|nr:class I SAM-dependent methyltransferase [Vicinamibacteria bacterium]
MDPLAGSNWSSTATVAGFSQSPPNAVLMRFIEEERRRRPLRRVLDIGCGAGRNAAPLADSGLEVIGTDLSWPMLQAARSRPRSTRGRLHLALCPMEILPLRDRSVDAVVAHGIWNLARSGTQFRQAVREAARACRPGGSLFLFTFSRNTLPANTQPVPGETFVFTQFSGEPQCFLTGEQILSELEQGGFIRDPLGPLTEYNRPQPGQLQTPRGPVIYEATFRRIPD